MKKTLIIIAFIVLSFNTMMFIACGDDNEEINNDENNNSSSDVYYDIVFKDYDDIILDTIKVKSGNMPRYSKSNPIRSNDDNYSYEFSNWVPSIVVATQNAVYTAEYTKIDLPYTISFDLNGGVSQSTITTIKTDSVKNAIFKYDIKKQGYTFKGWSYEGVIIFDKEGNQINNFTISSNNTFRAEFDPILTIDNQALSNGVIIIGASSGNSYEANSTIKLTASNMLSNYIIKWERSDGISYIGNSYTFKMPAYAITLSAITIRTYIKQEDFVYFGSYPQSRVTDSALIGSLNAQAGTLPISSNSYNWTDYGYYIGIDNGHYMRPTIQSYMWYQDIEYQNNKYRGVYFTQYRPYSLDKDSSAKYSYQDDNGYSISMVYWFRFEPIKWEIKTELDGKAFLVADLILDCQEFEPNVLNLQTNYYHNGGEGCADDYALSKIRIWLNDNFYNIAFNDLEKAIVAITAVENSKTSHNYVGKTTYDKIFLLSTDERRDVTEQVQGSDYAKSQGLYVYSDSTYSYRPYWFRTSAGNGMYCSLCILNFYDDLVSSRCDNLEGVRPACWINL